MMMETPFNKMKFLSTCFLMLLFSFATALTANAQGFKRELKITNGGSVEITNLFGRVRIEVSEDLTDTVEVTAQTTQPISAADFEIINTPGKAVFRVTPTSSRKRLDLTVKVPKRVRLKIETEEGDVSIDGNVSSAEVKTDTGTIATNIPLDNIKYSMWWSQSRPRVVSDVTLEEVKERVGGRFSIIGRHVDPDPEERRKEAAADEKPVDRSVSLDFKTARGIVLLNVSPNEVSSDLRERPLTNAAKSIVRSGDSMLTEAIRRSSPKYFGDYLRTLPPRLSLPSLTDRQPNSFVADAKVKRVVARVLDVNNRAVAGLQKTDFVLTEKGVQREILTVEPVTAPFNLVLLLDVSGSIENYVSFIRKAARGFLSTMSPEDKISIVIFSEDVKQIATFTTNRQTLSESLDTFDAGGGTAYYDAIAFCLVDALKPFKGERTAIVVLSDGDDNRSFLPFESLIGSIQESGALIYPLYVPSGLVAAAATGSSNQSIDPLRSKYMGLTSKAEGEGARLAKVSGGVYYPIRRLDELQKAYEDIVVQLRTAYTLTYRSENSEAGDSASPRLRVRVNREGTFVNLGAVTPVAGN
jgi:VWFA-related protein